MSFSRATSEVPPPRSPVHIPSKEPLRHTSPVPVPVSNGRDYREPSPKSIASALLSPASAAVVLPSEKEKTKEREGSVKPPTVAAAAEKKPPAAAEPEPEPGDVIDMETFEQILELDDGDSREFSHEMVKAYFVQAQSTFEEMEAALKAEDLEKLSSLGHFLKGSSAALGVAKVQATCETIQHLGKMQDNEKAIPRTEALAKLTPLLPQVKQEYSAAQRWLEYFYKDEE